MIRSLQSAGSDARCKSSKRARLHDLITFRRFKRVKRQQTQHRCQPSRGLRPWRQWEGLDGFFSGSVCARVPVRRSNPLLEDYYRINIPAGITGGTNEIQVWTWVAPARTRAPEEE